MDAERRAALAELLARADAAAAQPGHPAHRFDRDEAYADREARWTPPFAMPAEAVLERA